MKEEFNKSHTHKLGSTAIQADHFPCLTKRETTLLILNGAQMRVIEKFYRTDKHQLLFTLNQTSIARTQTILILIFLLQLEISPHHFLNRFGLNLRVQLTELLTLLKKDQLVLHSLVSNGAQMEMTDKFYSMEELLLSNIQTLDLTAKIPNMKVNNLQFENFVKLKN